MSDPRELLLLEKQIEAVRSLFETSKAEQLDRITKTRDRLLTVAVILYGSIAGAAFARAWVLTAAPLAGLVVGWSYLQNDQKISAIGAFIRDRLDPKYAALLQVEGPVFEWEDVRRADDGYRSRKWWQLGVELLLFVGIPSGSVVAYWCVGPWLWPAGLGGVVGVAAILALGREFHRYANVNAPGEVRAAWARLAGRWSASTRGASGR